jgi:REP element-mobilizing transposase RayT
MPNHIHGVITIVGAGLALPWVRQGAAGQGAASSAPTLGDVMRAFKSISAVHVNRLLSRSGQPLWQRNYYERVIRDEDELGRIRQYILDNPAKWTEDTEHPQYPARAK